MTRTFGLPILLAALVGCASAPRERVVLLPGVNGKVGKVSITSTAGTAVVDEAYAAATVDTAGKVAVSSYGANGVQQGFAEALAALPPRPVSYILYFELDSDQLTPESAQQATSVLAEIAARPVADIVVIGHTDSMGELEYNDSLSRQRAEALRQALLEQGGDPARISAAGRGERELLVPTADATPEPRNRRAELNVR
ncbi:MAG: OmpA family protein [Gammaproteobacteria bacterium]